MYEEDFIVENFLNGVIHPVKWRYTLHLIANISTNEIRDPLIDQLKSQLEYVDREEIISYIDRLANKNYNGPTIYRDLIEERSIEQRSALIEKVGSKVLNSTIDFSITAAAQTENYYFWNAIQSYKRDIRINHKSNFYEQRACLHMCLDEWSKAYSLSKKSQNPEYISVVGFSFGHFENVIQNLDPLLLLIRKRKTSIISVFELLHMMTFSFLCCFDFTSGEDPKLDCLMCLLQEENLMRAKMALQNFLQSRYNSAIEWVDSLEDFSALSVYMCFSFPSVQETIKENALIHTCYPYSSIEISKIASKLGISEDQTEEMIQKVISKNKLNYKIDYTKKMLHRVPKAQENYKKQELLRQTSTTTIKLNELLWRMNITKHETDESFLDGDATQSQV